MISRLFNRFRKDQPATNPVAHPQQPLLIIGDVHGCLADLTMLLDKVSGTPDLPPLEQTALIFVGDLIDRGPDSAGVIDLVRQLQATRAAPVEALLGNHEAMLLDFIDGAEASHRWLLHGGHETLRSFGLDPQLGETPDEAALTELRAQTVAAIGPERLEWLRARPLMFQSGDVVAVHAAFDTSLPADAQDTDNMIWGARAFYRKRHDTPPWVVHGHVITRPARRRGYRIAVDSGAYLGGGLSCVIIAPDATPYFVCSIDLPPEPETAQPH